jgi:predicted DNA-binding transcriptional regulator AlpA
MTSPNDSEFQSSKDDPPLNDSPPVLLRREDSNAPSLVAYIFVVPREAGQPLEVLRNLLSQRVFQNLVSFPAAEGPSSPTPDSWLSHPNAAKYLGISESTLYRYAEQERIECRKLCGRLQYRLASLDEFKNQHIRPARRAHRGGGIITSALSSGK